MPLFQKEKLIEILNKKNILCKSGKNSDIPVSYRPYLEKWLFNKDGFIILFNQNIDYIGIEDVTRIGPFFNISFLIVNEDIFETYNCIRLFNSDLFFSLVNNRIEEIGWSDSILANILTNDKEIQELIADNIDKNCVRKLIIRAANLACVIQTQVWEPEELEKVYIIIDKISLKIKNLIDQIHFGDKIMK